MSAVYLVRGDDPSLLSRAVQELVNQLLGDGDRSLTVEEIDEARCRDADGVASLAPLIDAAQTPPFLTDIRIVVGRALGQFSRSDQVGALVGYLDRPLDSTRLVLVWEKAAEQQRLGPVPKPLQAAIEKQGEVVDARAPKGRQMAGWLAEMAASAGVALDRGALKAIEDHMGDDHGRVPGLLETLGAAFGSGTSLSAHDVAPYLGTAGDVAPWELTDAISSGDVVAALTTLRRMQGAGGRHGLALLATLTNHYGRVLRLEGSGIGDEKTAAAVLGMKGSTFPAKKAMQEARRLGHGPTTQAIKLLAQADLDLRGATAVEDAATLEVLVARLARLHR